MHFYKCRVLGKITTNYRVLTIYSSLFMRFSWVVVPRNLLLLSVHTSNVILQSNLLIRRIMYERNNPELVALQYENMKKQKAKRAQAKSQTEKE